MKVSCIDALARMTTQRPDFFLMDKYLKYFGWLLSDKAEHVRIAALTGLLRPIHAAKTFEISDKGVNIHLSLSSPEYWHAQLMAAPLCRKRQ